MADAPIQVQALEKSSMSALDSTGRSLLPRPCGGLRISSRYLQHSLFFNALQVSIDLHRLLAASVSAYAVGTTRFAEGKMSIPF